MSKKPVVFRTKLGAAKKVERSRIWIEGKRLVDAGFTVGKYFSKEWHIDAALELTLLKPNDVTNDAPFKVSGKGGKPIIDITGEAVRNLFGALGTHVDVTFAKGVITIRPSAS